MRNQPTFKYVLLTLDVIVVSVAFVAVAFLHAVNLPPVALALLYLALLGTVLPLFRMSDLYKRHVVVTRVRQLWRAARSLFIGTGFIAAMVALVSFPYFRREGFPLLVDFFGLALALVIATRVLPLKTVMAFLARRDVGRSNLLIVGCGAAARHVAEALDADSLQTFRILGFVDHRPDDAEAGGRGVRTARRVARAGAVLLEEADDTAAAGRAAALADGVLAPVSDERPYLGRLDALAGIVRTRRVDEILIALDDTPYQELIRIVERCLATGKVVRVYSKVLDVVARKMNVEFYSAVPVIMLPQYVQRGRYPRFKRLFDVVLAGFGLVLLSPLFLVIAIGIRLSSKGPVLFRQERIGKDGAPFPFFKFRSMHLGCENDLHKQYVTNFIKKPTAAARNDDGAFKIQDDPRVFPFGKFIRKASLDEFPQLYNVLRGDMSLVGPRPCLKYEWECYDDWHKRRLEYLPGCTGLWQALGRSSVTFEEMVILDLYYISNVSLWLDLKIVLQTLPVILFGRGAY